MFTGLVEEVGVIDSIERKRKSVIFTIRAKETARDIRIDQSIAINGVCLTVIRWSRRKFQVQAVEETLQKTNLGELKEEDPVNLERALLPGERLGGHFVLGHVDGVGVVTKIQTRASSWMYWFKVPQRFSRYLIPVGSVAINGVSLTVARLQGREFAVSIIPHTMDVTIFRYMKVGDKANIEFDVLGKYVERLLKARLGAPRKGRRSRKKS
ncbi:MAG: riboflavin synthase [Ignavibacteriales bacterium]|nr:riboflavin synthase [Ignavibacteriales bacterium]